MLSVGNYKEKEIVFSFPSNCVIKDIKYKKLVVLYFFLIL